MDFAALVERHLAAQLMLAVLCVGFTLLAGLSLILNALAQRGSTLVIPNVWAIASLAPLTACVLVGLAWSDVSRSSDYAAWSFVAACGTFCPFAAIVGAKRPQHAAWSFVVATLWGMLALPAAEVLFLQPGQQLEINSFRSWFLVAILVAEALNFLFTRYALAVAILLAGQIYMLSPYLPFRALASLGTGELGRLTIGVLAIALSVLIAVVLSRPSRGKVHNRLDRLWFDFRDSFGLFWALRLMERVNDTAKQAGWNFDLGWTGFRTKQDFAPLGELPIDIEQPLRNTLQGLLRRFVSEQWIAERLDLPAQQSGAVISREPKHD
jgi:hypothetical protein